MSWRRRSWRSDMIETRIMVSMINQVWGLCAVLLCLTFSSAQEPVDDFTNWGAVGLGLTSIDAQVGWFDVGGTPVDLRAIAGYAFEGGIFAQGDAFWFAQGRSGFYGGGGLGIVAANSRDLVLIGPHFTLGGDIPIHNNSGILIDASFGYYPLILFYEPDPERPGAVFPVFGRFSVGYRFLF